MDDAPVSQIVTMRRFVPPRGKSVHPTSIIKLLAPTVAVSALLLACGGGSGDENAYSRTVDSKWVQTGDVPAGGGGAPAQQVNTAEGFWTGPVSSGFNLNLAVLENGEAWGVYASGNTIFGALQGSVKGEGTALTGNGTDYYFPTDSATVATVAGTVNQKTSIEARSSTGVTMSLKYSAAYDQPASLATLAGQYAISGRTFDGGFAANRLTIDSSGTFVLVDGQCTATGNLAPRNSGKNVFNLNVGFAGDCLITGPVAGVAYLETASTPMSLVALALKTDKSDGMIVVGTRIAGPSSQ
jgi:hypothetical protein